MSTSHLLEPPGAPQATTSSGHIRVALAGQPNVGKSTVFNMLTGLSQHVGNWPGKTVEQKVGIYHHDGVVMEVVDLPGTYSLTANSPEERIARDYIIKQRPNVVVVIVNAATLERSLYLLAELLSLPVPVVLGLNMIDVAEQQGVHIEPHGLEAALGLPVMPLVATKNQGVRELMAVVHHLAQEPSAFAPNRPTIPSDLQPVLADLRSILGGVSPPLYPPEWVALKLLEGDTELTGMMQAQLPPDNWEKVHALVLEHEDAMIHVARWRYEWIGRMVRAAVTLPPTGQIGLTDRVDHIATHPWFGLILLGSVLGLVFWLTYTVAAPMQAWLDTVVVEGAADWVELTFQSAPRWLVALLSDGIIAGAGTVLTFLPILIVFFASLGLLEDVGYLARAAFVMDRLMHAMGLHGKSCLALFLGFGCNVPTVLGARVVESERGRLLTILLAPLVPCAGRLMVVTFLAPVFFGPNAVWVAWGLISLNLLVLAGAGVLLNRVVFTGKHDAFIMELPLYHVPNVRTIGLYVWHHIVAFLQNAGTVIVIVSAVVWLLASYPGPVLEESFLAGLGRQFAPLGQLMGLDWRMMVALLSSFVAKENTIATLGVVFRASNEEASLVQALADSMTPASALAFLTVQMLFIPCAATVAVMRQELHSWRWTLVSVAILFVISFGMGIAIYQGSAAWQVPR